MKCPECGAHLPEALVMSAGARLMRRRRKPVDRSFMQAIGSVGGKEAGLKRKRAQIRKLMEKYERKRAAEVRQ